MSFGVVLEGELKARRSGNLAFFAWKAKYAVLSRSHRALFLWSGSSTAVEGAITRVPLEQIDAVLHDKPVSDAYSNSRITTVKKKKTIFAPLQSSRNFSVRPRDGDLLELGAANGEEAVLWVSSLRCLMITCHEADSAAALLRLCAAGPAVVHAHVEAIPTSRSAVDALPRTSAQERASTVSVAVVPELTVPPLKTAEPAPPNPEKELATTVSEKFKVISLDTRDAVAVVRVKAATTIQRILRGFLARRLVAGWVRVFDPADGDIYWHHAQRDVSSWFPPGTSQELMVAPTGTSLA